MLVYRTMLGWDECSPSPAHDSQGNQCRDTCHEREVDGKVMMMMMMMMMMMILQ